jgi:hypothetical protein
MEHAQGAKKNGRFKGVRKAIKERDIAAVSWSLLEMCIDDLEEHGEIKLLGKTGLMEMVRIISVQKNADGLASRMERVEELKEWLRKAA